MGVVSILPKIEEQKYRDILVKNNVANALVYNKTTLVSQYESIRTQLPNVTPFYAIKSCPHITLMKDLRDMGCMFDVATKGEIDLLSSIDVSGNNTIHTHPIKSDAEIQYGIKYGCRVFVIDNIDELKKFIPYKDKTKLLLRLSFPNPDAVVDLSRKFGCTENDVGSIMECAASLGIQIIGLSFHVGSQSKNAHRHAHAIRVCNGILRKYNMSILDIGGGFPIKYNGSQTQNIDVFFAHIRDSLEMIDPSVSLYCEPGRYLSGPSMYCVSVIEGKSKRIDATWYYMNDGIYGSYSGILFDHVVYNMMVFSDEQSRSCSVLSGPTCDSIDVVASGEMLPDLNIGDVVVGLNMGAYTMATSTIFNCVPLPPILDM